MNENESCSEEIVFNGNAFQCVLDAGHDGLHSSGGIKTERKEIDVMEWGVEDGEKILNIRFPVFVALFLPDRLDKVNGIRFLASLLEDEFEYLRNSGEQLEGV